MNMETMRLIGRGSRLSLLQLEIVRQKIQSAIDNVNVRIITRESRGDALQNIPLHTVEGNDFFTRDIFDALINGEADIAVHSLKDMSTEHFFGSNKFAVVDRNDTRDVAILSPRVKDKIEKGEAVVIGTCSPRREQMAVEFLRKALPQLNKNFQVTTKDIRGNVDTRLRKLDNGEYDGIILATAGLNRLLSNNDDAALIRPLLHGKVLMLLPLIECVPAPCQGAIVIESLPENNKALAVINKINDVSLMKACAEEKWTARQYGVGCLQKFGVTTIKYGSREVLYAAGKDSEGTIFTKWTGLPEVDVADKNFFSTTDFMGDFFQYEYNTNELKINEPIVYVANYKAAEQKQVIDQLRNKRLWAAGTKTWFELAKKGLWVEGCADAFGLEFLQKPWQMPLLDISITDVAVLTSNEAADIWRAKNWNAYGTYSTAEKHLDSIKDKIRAADTVFWTSFRQYQQYRNDVKKDVQHLCSYGETAEQFRAAGIDPIIFPNLKAFQQWRQTSIRSHSVA